MIAGAGPAGLVAAIAVRRKGLSVLVADRAHAPMDKACGEGLMPEAVAALESLDVTFEETEFHPFRGIRFSDSGRSVEARFPSGRGYGIRRTTLNRVLIKHAEELGVRILWDAPVAVTGHGAAEVRGEPIRFGFLVGADGENSAVRRQAGLDCPARGGQRFGFRRHFQVAPWTDFVEVHWGQRCQIYVTPVGPRLVNVTLLSKDPDLRLNAALARFPELASRLENAPSASSQRGSVSASRRLDRVYRDHIALVGDASGSVDAVTGYGMSLAFQQAIALSGAIESGDLEIYQREHDRIGRRPALMAEWLLLMDGRELLRRRVFAAFLAKPAMFANLLALHVGRPTLGVLASTILTLGWSLLTA